MADGCEGVTDPNVALLSQERVRQEDADLLPVLGESGSCERAIVHPVQARDDKPLSVPLPTVHASTSPASFMPCARPHAKRCSTTKAFPNHIGSGWTCSSIHSLLWKVRGQNRKTVPSLRTRTSGVIGTCEELLIMRAPL